MRKLSLLLLVLAGCGGQADLVPLSTDKGDDRGFAPPEVRSLSCDAASGQAPYATRCTFEVAAPDDGVTCDISVNGGEVKPASIAACHSGEVLVNVESVGETIVEVAAHREGGSTLRAQLKLQGLNRAPSIDAFTPSKKSGTAPVTSTLQWKLSDPNGDAIHCTLAVDGTVVEAFDDCSAVTSSTQTFQSGTHQIALTAIDSHDGQSSAEVQVAAVPPVGDVTITKVELGQSVMSQKLRLVPGKQALLRVFAQADTAGLAAKVRVQRMVNGAVADTITLTGPATYPTQEQPGQLSSTFNYVMPEAWIATGIELRVQADPDDDLPETNEDNNTTVVKPDVGLANQIAITTVPVVFQGNTGMDSDFIPTLHALYPLQNATKKMRAPYTFNGNFTDQYGGWSQLLGEVGSLRSTDSSNDYYYGFIDMGAFGGGIAGLGYLGQPAAVGLSAYTSVLAHEVGHNLSLPHAPCGAVSGANASFPYPNGVIGSWGVDLNGPQLINPSVYDLMGYCQPVWISDYYYAQTQNFLEAHPYVLPAPVPPAPMILVRGSIDPLGNVQLAPVHRIVSVATPDRGENTMRVATAHGVIERHFELSTEAEQLTRHFTVLMPDPGEIESLEISGATVFKMAAKPHAAFAEPVVQVLSDRLKITWTGAESVLVANVNGTQRSTLALDLRGGSAEVLTGGISGGVWEISASDGLNATRYER
ncbi:MAG: M66 family metalloprotease [Myxococcaceae bacterium]